MGYLTIKKEVEVEIQVETARCYNCGSDLGFEGEVDNWGDIQIKVNPCTCLLEEYKEGLV